MTAHPTRLDGVETLDPEDVRRFAMRPWRAVESAQLLLDDRRFARVSPAEWVAPMARWTLALAGTPGEVRSAREREDLEHHLALNRLFDALALHAGAALD